MNCLLLAQPNREEPAHIGGTDGSKIEGESKDGPIVLDGTEVGVVGIRQHSVTFELTTDYSVWSSLVTKAIAGVGGPIPIAVLRLVGDLRKCLLCLAVDLVIRNIASGPIVPLGNVGTVARNPLCNSQLIVDRKHAEKQTLTGGDVSIQLHCVLVTVQGLDGNIQIRENQRLALEVVRRNR